MWDTEYLMLLWNILRNVSTNMVMYLAYSRPISKRRLLKVRVPRSGEYNTIINLWFIWTVIAEDVYKEYIKDDSIRVTAEYVSEIPLLICELVSKVFGDDNSEPKYLNAFWYMARTVIVPSFCCKSNKKKISINAK
jgi:hypothetical protein